MEKTCSIDGCLREVYNKTHCLCNAHYMRLKRTGNPLGIKGGLVRQIGIEGVCTNPGCERPVHNKTRLLCQRCYQYWWRTEKEDTQGCLVDGCDKPHFTKGYCSSHSHRLRRYGDPLGGSGRGCPGKRRGIFKLKGENITSNGYKKIRIEDGENKVKWMLEHRYVIEQSLGRKLFPEENIHHKDGDRLNNSLENLEIWVKPQPQGIRIEDAILWAKEILRRYDH